MSILPAIAALLLSLAGYSIGTVTLFGRGATVRPTAIDLLVVGVLWACVIYSAVTLSTNKWILLAGGIAAGLAFACVLALIRGGSSMGNQVAHPGGFANEAHHRQKFRAWREFSNKIGTLQSQILLGLLFLLIYAPFAIWVKSFLDPLHIRKSVASTHWSPKAQVASDINVFRRQY